MAEKPREKLSSFRKHNRRAWEGVLSEKISRRSFGKLLGAQTVLASSVTLSGCLGGGGGGSDDAPAPASKTLIEWAEFVTTISDHFDWAHSSEYIDQFKSLQQTFADVSLGTTAYAKQIETALEAGLIDNSQGYFYPTQQITREEAADIYVKAFKIPAAVSNPLTGYTDAGSISSGQALAMSRPCGRRLHERNQHHVVLAQRNIDDG